MDTPITKISEVLDSLNPLNLGTTSESRTDVTFQEARRIGTALGIDWVECGFSIEWFRKGMVVELEHGTRDPDTDVTGDDLIKTGKIAWAHLKEFPDYYQRLEKMEMEARLYWKKKGD